MFAINYLMHGVVNFIFILSSVLISAIPPIGITAFLSVCPKLLDFIIGKLYLFPNTCNKISSKLTPYSVS